MFSFAEAGAKGVICADIKGDDATKVAEESIALAAFPNFRSLGFSLDITDSQSIKNFIEFTVREFRRINYLVNAAGVSTERRREERFIAYRTYIDRCRSACTIQCHFRCRHAPSSKRKRQWSLLISKAVAPVMTEQEPHTVKTKRFGTRSLSRGAIVHIASAMAFGAVPYKTPYITAKHALLGIVRASGKRDSHRKLNRRLTLACQPWT